MYIRPPDLRIFSLRRVTAELRFSSFSFEFLPGIFLDLRDRAEGARAFFRGLWPSMLRAFPLHALVFVGYETTIDFLGAHRTQHGSQNTAPLP